MRIESDDTSELKDGTPFDDEMIGNGGTTLFAGLAATTTLKEAPETTHSLVATMVTTSSAALEMISLMAEPEATSPTKRPMTRRQ